MVFEKVDFDKEKLVDIRAAEKFSKLYDIVLLKIILMPSEMASIYS